MQPVAPAPHLELSWSHSGDRVGVRDCLAEVALGLVSNELFSIRWGDDVARGVDAGRVLCARAATHIHLPSRTAVPDGGEVVGVVALFTPSATGAAHQVFATLLGGPTPDEVGWLAVRPSWRGQGVAHQLVTGCIERALGQDLSQLAATIAPHNAPSLATFTSLGFEVRGRTRMYGGNHRLVLARRL
jgi:GNAT superfamily N-acetyltransferase